MALRIIVGLVSGVIFLSCCLYSFWTALIIAGLVNALGQFEFCRLVPRITPGACFTYVGFSTAIYTAAALSLAGRLSPAWIAVPLALVALYYATVTIVSYERTGGGLEQWLPLRSVLLVTLPLAFLPVIASNPAPFPFFMLLLGASWGADTGAIFAGKMLGRRKLAPRISPHKTVEGFAGGMISSGAVWALAGAIYPLPAPWLISLGPWREPLWIALLFAGGALVALAGVAGDLTFSLFKRQSGIKDFGRILPGHGGVLDRFDSFFFVTPFVYLISLLH